jgi:hypothetical protein
MDLRIRAGPHAWAIQLKTFAMYLSGSNATADTVGAG